MRLVSFRPYASPKPAGRFRLQDEKPQSLFVAGFIGSPKMNFIATRAEQLNGQLGLHLQDRLQLMWDHASPALQTGESVTLAHGTHVDNLP